MENRKSSHGGTLNTFFFGVLVGIAITLLFTTKKGRRLLKVITEEGSHRIAKWEDMVKMVEEDVEEELYDDDEPAAGEDYQESEREMVEQPKDHEERKKTHSAVESPKSQTRRFFKGVRKKTS